VLHIEHLQATIGALAVSRRFGNTRSGLDTAYTANEPAELLVIIQHVAELDPGGRGEEGRQMALFSPAGSGQQHRHHAEPALTDTAVDGGAHLRVLPGSDAAGADEHGATAALVQCLFDLLLPGIAGDQIPFVQPGLDALRAQAMGQRLDGGFVGGIVREEDVGHAQDTSILAAFAPICPYLGKGTGNLVVICNCSPRPLYVMPSDLVYYLAMEHATVTIKGQVTIPVKIRKLLGIKVKT
jgi:hypothetical protein